MGVLERELCVTFYFGCVQLLCPSPVFLTESTLKLHFSWIRLADLARKKEDPSAPIQEIFSGQFTEAGVCIRYFISDIIL